MRKSNWIVVAVIVALSALLLWAWFALGFHHVDAPLDMIATAAWWVVLALVIYLILWSERKRREKMLTAFVGRGVVYNPETGAIRTRDGETEVALLAQILSGLKFSDDIVDLQSNSRATFRWVVRTSKFDEDGAVWEGEVLSVRDPNAAPVPFQNREALAELLAA